MLRHTFRPRLQCDTHSFVLVSQQTFGWNIGPRGSFVIFPQYAGYDEDLHLHISGYKYIKLVKMLACDMVQIEAPHGTRYMFWI